MVHEAAAVQQIRLSTASEQFSGIEIAHRWPP
jgi:hypothetical protein